MGSGQAKVLNSAERPNAYVTTEMGFVLPREIVIPIRRRHARPAYIKQKDESKSVRLSQTNSSDLSLTAMARFTKPNSSAVQQVNAAVVMRDLSINAMRKRAAQRRMQLDVAGMHSRQQKLAKFLHIMQSRLLIGSSPQQKTYMHTSLHAYIEHMHVVRTSIHICSYPSIHAACTWATFDPNAQEQKLAACIHA